MKSSQTARTSASKQPSLKIRLAQSDDVTRIAGLSGQLGYPAKPHEIFARLRRLRPASHHAVFVAETLEQNVVGWVHVTVTPLLEVELRAEINGLVVDDQERSRGTGALLTRAAEEWARKKGCKTMSVRSNVLRKRAHLFYLRNGYEHYKTQKAFKKRL